MNKRFVADMAAATRLTREGRLSEAMAKIRGALAGESATGASQQHGSSGRAGPTPPLLHEPATERPAGRGASHSGWSDAAFGRNAPRRGRSAPSVPEGARFVERAFASDAGALRYKLYVPAGYTGQPLPLVVMLHGCTQSPDDFALGTRMNAVAEEQGLLVAYPAQTKAANPARCWNWFKASEQQRERGEPALIAGVTRQIMQDFAVSEGQVYVAGLSAGGAAAAIMGVLYPELYAAVGVHSGLACGAARDLPSGLAAMRHGAAPSASRNPTAAQPTIVFHGDQDKTVHPSNGSHVIAHASSGDRLASDVQRGQTAAGVRYTRQVQSNERGVPILEHWEIHGLGHVWSGGSPEGSYTGPQGPDASREMVRFFLHHRVGRE